MSQLCVNCGKEEMKKEENSIDDWRKYEKDADAETNTNISISKMISLVFNINVSKNAYENDVKYFMCSSCSETFQTIYYSRTKLLQNIVENSYLSKIVSGRQDAVIPLQSVRNEFINADCSTSSICPEAILPDQEENVDNLKLSTLDKTYTPCVVLKELFLRLEIPKLSTDHVKSVLKSKFNSSADGNVKPSALKRKRSGTAPQKKSKRLMETPPQNQIATCTKCFRLFPNEELMQNHFDAVHETNEQKLSCSFCSSKFSSHWFFKHHVKTCHQGIEILYACKICTISFHCEADLQEHNEKTHRKHPFGCNNCMESFNKIAELRTHLITSHEKSKEALIALSNIKELQRLKNFKKCTICNKSCHSISHMQQHKKAEHGVSEFTCFICGEDKIFDSETILKQHLTDHTKCDICGKSFSKLRKLKLHIEVMHWTTQEFGCEMCGLRRSSLTSLGNHYGYHKAKAGPRVFCNICNKSYIVRGHLVLHMKYYHSSETALIPCEECGEKFVLRGSLNEHLLTVHKLVAEFACSKCDRTFLHESSLRAHSNIHGKEYIYEKAPALRLKKVVTYNGQIETTSCFSEETALFTCPVCGKTMEWKTHLLRHLRCHNLKAYTDLEKESQLKRTIKCPDSECKKMFTRKDILSRHIRRHHAETSKQYKNNASTNCKLCGLHVEGAGINERRFHEQLHTVQIILGKGNSDTNGDNKNRKKMDLTSFYNYKRKEYKCTFCSTRIFFAQQQQEFINHLKKSHKLKISNKDLDCGLLRVECKQCKKRFTTPYQLKRHEKEGVCGKKRLRISGKD